MTDVWFMTLTSVLRVEPKVTKLANIYLILIQDWFTRNVVSMSNVLCTHRRRCEHSLCGHSFAFAAGQTRVPWLPDRQTPSKPSRRSLRPRYKFGGRGPQVLRIYRTTLLSVM